MSWTILLLYVNVTELHIPTPVALAAVAVVGYLFGCRRRNPVEEPDVQARREIKRAKAVAHSLETIAQAVRKELAMHHAKVARFKEQVARLGETGGGASWQELCVVAESILGPTLQLAAQMAHAYDQIRQQGNQLMTFTEVRTDPLTGVSNRRALDETLHLLLAMRSRYGAAFSMIIFDIDHFKQINDRLGHLAGDDTLKAVARLIDEAARETDMVARYGGEEFVVLMPETELAGACLFAQRVNHLVESRLDVTVSGGVAAVRENDTAEKLFGRADAALYQAKMAGRNCTFQHDGCEARRVEARPAQTPSTAVALAGE